MYSAAERVQQNNHGENAMVAAANQIPAAANYGIVDTQRLAEFFGVSRDTIDRRRKQLPPGFKLGRFTFWHLETVVEHVRKAGIKFGNPDA